MERRKFLQNTCPTVTFAFFGISFIQACSKSSDDEPMYNSGSANSQSNPYENDSQGSSSETNNGISVSGNTITLDLKNSTFGSLNNPGDFVNLTSIDLLVLKISNTEFRAFDNCCPHNGSKDSWSYSNDQFTCGTHGNSFSIDGNDVKSCNSGSTSGGLKRYTTSLDGDNLTVTT